MTNTTLLVGYLGQGLAASKPVAPSADVSTLTFYYSNDTAILEYYDWNAAVWVEIPVAAGFAVLNLTNAFTAAQTGPTGALTDAATVAWDASTIQIATLTIGGNRTLGAPSTPIIGTYVLKVTQDMTGSRTLAYNAVFKWPGGTAPTLSTAAAAVDVLTFICDGTNFYGTAQLAFS